MQRTAADLINRFRGLLRNDQATRRPRRLVADLNGQLVYIGPSPAEIAQRQAPAGVDRTDVVAAWSATGDLDWSEADELLALDESTPWGRISGGGSSPPGR